MMKTLLLGTVAALSLSSAVLAADAIYEAPAEPPVAEAAPAFTWAGGYAGIHTGYGFGDIDIDGFGSTDLNGARIGGFAGYNWQLSGGFVVGLEGDINYDWNEENLRGVDLETGLSGSGRVRAGYAMDRALFFAAGGVAASQVKASVPGFSDEDTAIGWTAGAGVDYALTDKMFTRVEYRYNDFGTAKIDGVDTDFNQHVINVGLGVKF